MKLIELTLNDYLALLGSDAPAPGGGSASALCGAQGAQLAGMVARLTLGRAKYAEYQTLCEETALKCDELAARLAQAVDRDTEAYNLISAAFKLPKETDEEKAVRKQAVADATLAATQVPFDTLCLAAEGLCHCEELVGKSNVNAASDLGVAALNLNACANGAWLNVRINLSGVKDEVYAARFETEGKRLLAEAQERAARIAAQIAEAM